MNRKTNHKGISIRIIILLTLLLSASTLVCAGGETDSGSTPVIINASVYPDKVVPGDVMTVTAEITDENGIKSVIADMAGIENITLNLVGGDIYNGTWQNNWTVHSTQPIWYNTTITAENLIGNINTSKRDRTEHGESPHENGDAAGKV